MTHMAYTPADPDMGRHMRYHKPLAQYTAREDVMLQKLEAYIARKWMQEVNGDTGKPAKESTISNAQKEAQNGCNAARKAKVVRRQLNMQRFIDGRKEPARIHQIAEHMGLSHCSVRKYAHQMAAEGRIVVDAGRPGIPMTVRRVGV